MFAAVKRLQPQLCMLRGVVHLSFECLPGLYIAFGVPFSRVLTHVGPWPSGLSDALLHAGLHPTGSVAEASRALVPNSLKWPGTDRGYGCGPCPKLTG